MFMPSCDDQVFVEPKAKETVLTTEENDFPKNK